MRKIKYLVVHCTATPHNTKIESIRRYWKETLKWKSPGYHIIVLPSGSWVRLAADSEITNGVAGFNSQSLHVSYIGGVDSKGKSVDNRTDAQKATILTILESWKRQYPNAIIQGHRDFPAVKKDCPCFDAKAEYKNLKPSKSI